MKILIKSTTNLSSYYVHAYETWRDALALEADVVCYGDGYENFLGWKISDGEIYEHLGFCPDIELWCGGPGNPKPQYISNEHIASHPIPHIPKLILLTDFWEIARDSSPATWLERERELRLHGVVGYFSFYCQAQEWMRHYVRSTFGHYVEFPYAADPAFFIHDQGHKWDINLQLCLNACYPFRNKVFNHISLSSARDGISFFRETNNGSHEYKNIPGDNDPLNRFFHGGVPSLNYARLVNSCKITIADGYTKYCSGKHDWGLPDEDLFLARYSQTLASSSTLFCPLITSSHIDPLVPDVHYVSINEDDFYDKILYYLSHQDELSSISKNANKWAQHNCSGAAVAEKIQASLKKVISSVRQERHVLKSFPLDSCSA